MTTTRLGLHHVVKREVVLLEEELDGMRDTALVLLARREVAEEERKKENKNRKDAINGLSAQIHHMMSAIQTGKEERELTVVWRRMEDGEGAELIEVKTGRRLELRPLDVHEKQIDIKDIIKESPELPDDNGEENGDIIAKLEGTTDLEKGGQA